MPECWHGWRRIPAWVAQNFSCFFSFPSCLSAIQREASEFTAAAAAGKGGQRVRIGQMKQGKTLGQRWRSLWCVFDSQFDGKEVDDQFKLQVWLPKITCGRKWHHSCIFYTHFRCTQGCGRCRCLSQLSPCACRVAPWTSAANNIMSCLKVSSCIFQSLKLKPPIPPMLAQHL